MSPTSAAPLNEVRQEIKTRRSEFTWSRTYPFTLLPTFRPSERCWWRISRTVRRSTLNCLAALSRLHSFGVGSTF